MLVIVINEKKDAVSVVNCTTAKFQILNANVYHQSKYFDIRVDQAPEHFAI